MVGMEKPDAGIACCMFSELFSQPGGPDVRRTDWVCAVTGLGAEQLRSRRRVVVLVTVALLLGTAAVLQYNPWLFESRKERRARVFFAYAQRSLGGMLDGVSLRFCSRMEKVVIVDPNQHMLTCFLDPYGLSNDSVDGMIAAFAARLEVARDEFQVDRSPVWGCFSRRERTIRINRNGDWDLQTIGHEIAHAAVTYPQHKMDFAFAPFVRKLDEAFAGTLGEVDLVFAFLEEERGVDPGLLEWGRVDFYDQYWQRAMAPPDESWPPYLVEVTECYRHGEHIAGTVCGIAEADEPLEARFRRARQMMRVYAGVE